MNYYVMHSVKHLRFSFKKHCVSYFQNTPIVICLHKTINIQGGSKIVLQINRNDSTHTDNQYLDRKIEWHCNVNIRKDEY